jgi:hypothetical protein
MILARLSTAGMKVNISKSKFFEEQIEYLGYWITRQGIQPIRNKVEAILIMKAPKTRKELRQFIGIVNYHRNMWFRRSELLAPLTRLTSSRVNYELFHLLHLGNKRNGGRGISHTEGVKRAKDLENLLMGIVWTEILQQKCDQSALY